MPGASVFLYGRRSRSSRTIETLTSSTSSSTQADSNHSGRRHSHRRRSIGGQSLRYHHAVSFDDSDHVHPPPSFLSPIQESELRRCDSESSSRDINESSSRDINTRDAVRDSSRRFSSNNTLPGPVLLAKGRLLQRLRSVSVSASRQNTETPPSSLCNNFWVIDADWETNIFREPTTSEASQESMPVEPKKKPLGLTKKILSQLHHELFIEHENANECSICLENFTEGNELVSLPCEHRFHTQCLYPWLLTCGDCPNCRSCIMLAS